jgi:isopentenyl-diphosphate delta-isomerase
MEVATRRRLRDELNLETELEFIYKFCYQADFESIGSENELCHVYLGRLVDEVRPNDHEIAALRFISARALHAEFENHPERFTPWFRMEWTTLVTEHRDQLAQYCKSL